MTQQNKLYEAAKALIGDLINKRSHFNSFQNLCRVLPEYEQSIEQPKPKIKGYKSERCMNCAYAIKLTANQIRCNLTGKVQWKDEQCSSFMYSHECYVESIEQPEAIAGEKTKTEIWHKWDAKPDLSYNEAAYGAMIEYASQQTSAKDKEIAELKEAISELIQVKDWKDKYGKDEHYLKAMPIAWENVRKLIQKQHESKDN